VPARFVVKQCLRLQGEVERTLKSRNQFGQQREVLVPGLFNQIMQRFSSISHIMQVSAEILNV
jgi:hypothetical protein